MFALGQDFNINNSAGQPVFKIDGKVRMVKESLKFRDMQGKLLYQLDEKVLRIRESFDILESRWNAGRQGPQCHRRSAARTVYDRDPRQGKSRDDGQGHLGAIRHPAREQTGWQDFQSFSWIGRDQYVVDVLQGENDCLILAITVVIDMMVSNGR